MAQTTQSLCPVCGMLQPSAEIEVGLTTPPSRPGVPTVRIVMDDATRRMLHTRVVCQWLFPELLAPRATRTAGEFVVLLHRLIARRISSSRKTHPILSGGGSCTFGVLRNLCRRPSCAIMHSAWHRATFMLACSRL